MVEFEKRGIYSESPISLMRCRRCTMVADIKQIYDFAVKWCDKFRDLNINYIELVDHYMADECADLGFVMDCGHAFSKKIWTSSKQL